MNKNILSKKKFSSLIGLPKDAYQSILDYPLTIEEYKEYSTLFLYHRNDFFKKVQSKGETESFALFLKLYFEFTYEKYLNSDELDGEIVIDGGKDLGLWAKKCYFYYKVWGIQNYMYMFLDRIIDGRITRLGRLEFEPKALEKDIEINSFYLNKGSIILNVHVPEGSPLTKEECDKSYNRAIKYFKGVPLIFFCDSWLLSPVLPKLLSENSNILSFQKDYILIDIDEDSRLMEERLWDVEDMLDDPSGYEEKTSLQSNARRWLMDGKKLKTACGILLKYFDPKIKGDLR